LNQQNVGGLDNERVKSSEDVGYITVQRPTVIQRTRLARSPYATGDSKGEGSASPSALGLEAFERADFKSAVTFVKKRFIILLSVLLFYYLLLLYFNNHDFSIIL
jgi:hypothetical protein